MKKQLLFMTLAMLVSISTWADEAIYCRGGLQDVGNWADTQVYPLTKNSEGIYEGVVKFVDCNMTDHWGTRMDLFFKFPDGSQYGCALSANNDDRFITPANTETMELAAFNNANTFQAMGGDYKVYINAEAMTVRFECIREYWVNEVLAIGTLDGVKAWDNADHKYTLAHQGKGIYRGTITAIAAEGGNLGEFSIQTTYNGGSNEGRYGTSGNPTLETGWTMPVIRTNSNTSKWSVVPGQWVVTFDMNNGSVRINTPAEPDVNYGTKELGENNAPIYCKGGLLDVGNWAETEKYPLYKNTEGVYVGIVKFTDLTLTHDATRWGNRSDLFFFDGSGNYWYAAPSLNSEQKFITPSKTDALPIATSGNAVFQALAGDYMVYLDTKNLTVRFECVKEAWLDEIYCAGTLKGHRWNNSVAEDRSNVLTHTSNGIYTGTITLEEDLAESGMGSFFVETAYNAGNEGRYSPATDKEIVQPNAPLNVGRYNSGALSISAPVGTWEITFDWSKGIVSIEKPAVGEIHVSDKGMATYYNKVGYTMPEGLRGATVSLKRTTDYGYIVEPNWKYAAGDAVPAGEALLIEGTEGTYTARQNEGSEAPTAGNLLHGEFTEGTGANAGQFFTAYNDGKDNLFYKLTTKDGADLGFYWGAADGAAFYMSSSDRAYLVVEKAVAENVKSFTLFGTDGIAKVADSTSENATLYDLSGRRVEKATKGIYIVNGKKIAVK